MDLAKRGMRLRTVHHSAIAVGNANVLQRNWHGPTQSTVRPSNGPPKKLTSNDSALSKPCRLGSNLGEDWRRCWSESDMRHEIPRTQTTADLSLRPTMKLLRLHNQGGLWWGDKLIPVGHPWSLLY